jgi:hypothetical protein
MEAPLYPPATVYREPSAAPFEFCIDTVVVAELVRSPTILEMLESKIPNFGRIMHAPMLKPHLSNFTLRSLADFGVVSPDLLAEIDELLRNWPESERPPL